MTRPRAHRPASADIEKNSKPVPLRLHYPASTVGPPASRDTQHCLWNTHVTKASDGNRRACRAAVSPAARGPGQNQVPMDEFLTVAEVAEILKLNQQTVRNWIIDGSLPALRAGRRVRIRRQDFLAFLDNGYTGHGPPRRAFDAQAFWDGEEMPLPELPKP